MRKNTVDDIWKFLSKGKENDCWPYTGSTFGGKYGRFFLAGKAIGAHVIIYKIFHGDIDDNLMVMHKCNNKLCCNPKHLTIGTNQKNQLHAVHSRAWKAGASGIMGVGYDKKREYWTAQCFENGKRRNLYTGPSKEKAITARKNWEELNL